VVFLIEINLMIKKVIRIFIAAVVLILFGAAAKFVLIGKDLNVDEVALYMTKSKHEHNIQLTYLGCAGFLIEHNNKSILCDPYISNPSLPFFGKEYLEWNKNLLEDQLKSINLVTISHGHYDHCYDIGTLCDYLNPATKIIADKGVQYQLNAIYTKHQVSKIALDYNQTSAWIYDSARTFRVLPLQSIHSPHIGKIEFFKGTYNQPLDQLPRAFRNWKKGNVYSYLIDVLNETDVQYRIILINGNLSESALTKLKLLSEERKSDLQLQIFWNEQYGKKNMMEVYNIVQPKEVILQHWNNFFRSHNKTLQYLRTSNLPYNLKQYRKNDIPVSIMLPFQKITL
jgi:metal-dependent hydrolase (beta-lactamase superfamily II)